ncbi:MAG: C39 family peptidase [Candidatus Bathyarchaeia archaeon]
MTISKKGEVKLDAPLIHSDAQLCHVDSLSMTLRYIGDRYEPWYIGGTSRRFFGFGYYPSKEYVQIRTGTFPLKALLTFLKEHGYSFQFLQGKSWNDAFPILKKFLLNGLPVLVISHMGWLSYNKEYEIFRKLGGVVDHYVVITGLRDDEVVYVNDPNPDFFRKDAELAIQDFRIGWAEKIPEIYQSCPMLVVSRRKHKPELKKILAKSLQRALKQMHTKRGATGIAGLKKASKEIPELLREDALSIRNSLEEFAYFRFRVIATEAKYASKFLDYAAKELNIPELKISAKKLLIASDCFKGLRNLFINCVQGQRKLTDIADDTEILLVKAYEAERDCFLNLASLKYALFRHNEYE